MPAGVPTPEGFACLTDAQLRAVGLSRQKSAYLRDLCDKVSTRGVDLAALDALSDEDIIKALVTVKGIGRWSAEMFLIFRLLRPDVLPVDDLGIVVAVQRAYRLRKRPTPEKLRKIGAAWAPYRSVACWYLWRSLDNEPVAAPPAKIAGAHRRKAGQAPRDAAEACPARRRPDIIKSSVRTSTPLLGGRSTVGHHALDVVIGVRIPASQPNCSRTLKALHHS